MMWFRDKKVDFSSAQVMGILNVTPDSFSDGGQFNHKEKALLRAQEMLDEGACFIDVGGESTRPGASEVSLQEELDRVVPVVEMIANKLDVLVSVDTSKPEVMTAAVEAGASLINDVRALSYPGALDAAVNAAKQYGVPTCLMHMKGDPKNMQNSPQYGHVVEEVRNFFETRLNECVAAGFEYEQLLLDPGFGFGKTLDHNYQLLKHLAEFSQFGRPVLIGTSRKSMIGNLLNREVDQRLAGNIASATLAAHAGVQIIRVHDVKETVDAIKIVSKMHSVD